MLKTSEERNRNGAGKGDRPRPVDRKKWDKAWERYDRKRNKKN